MFNEKNSDFYDLEYFLSMEYRYISGAHGSRLKNILQELKDVKTKIILDAGSGDGFITNQLHRGGGRNSRRGLFPVRDQICQEPLPPDPILSAINL